MLQTLLHNAVTIAVAVVFCVLCAGLYVMARGDSPNLSQKIMRWRVGLQFAAVVIIMLFVYVSHLAKA